MKKKCFYIIFTLLLVTAFTSLSFGFETDINHEVKDIDPTVRESTDSTENIINPTISIGLGTGNKYILKNATNDVFLMVDVVASEAKLTNRMPLNLGVVIDRSGSMASENKLENVKKAVKFLIKNMLSTDIISIVAYDSNVYTLSGAQPVIDKEKLINIIDDIRPGSATCLSCGLEEGIKEVSKNLSSEKINRVMVLSDGLANEGVTELTELTAIAKKAADKGVNVTSMGVGVDYDEMLMTNLAEYGRGNYYFIKSPETVPDIFKKELKELSALVIKDAYLNVIFPKTLVLHDIYGYDNFESKDGKIRIPIGEFYSGDNRRIVFHFKAFNPNLKEYAFAMTVDYHDISLDKSDLQIEHDMSIPVIVDEKKYEESYDNDVMAEVEYVRCSGALNDAMDKLSEGDREGAKQIIQENRQRAEKYNIENKRLDGFLDYMEEQEEVLDEDYEKNFSEDEQREYMLENKETGRAQQKKR